MTKSDFIKNRLSRSLTEDVEEYEVQDNDDSVITEDEVRERLAGLDDEELLAVANELGIIDLGEEEEDEDEEIELGEGIETVDDLINYAAALEEQVEELANIAQALSNELEESADDTLPEKYQLALGVISDLSAAHEALIEAVGGEDAANKLRALQGNVTAALSLLTDLQAEIESSLADSVPAGFAKQHAARMHDQ